jgi:DNA-binding CsgD family transcriptional regulator
MARSAHIPARSWRDLHQLVGECRGLGDSAAHWRAHWVAGLARLIDADSGISGEMAGVRAGDYRDLGHFAWGLGHGFDAQGYVAGLTHLATRNHRSVLLPAYAAHPADGTALGVADLLAPRAWEFSDEYQVVYRVFGSDGPLYCLPPLPGAGDVASGEQFVRLAGRPPFTARQKAVATAANALVRPLVGGPLARYADPSPAALPPRARQVLRCFLEGDSDKQVMARLALSRHTVNGYAKLIHRHFGVTSRPELLARWVRRGWPVGGWADS